MLPPYVVIEGNIGAGKTTLARRLAEHYDRQLVLETFEDNPFLPLFYEDPRRHALTVELFFMAERHRQLQAQLARPELFSSGVVADFMFVKTLLFAHNSLEREEFQLFTRLFEGLNNSFPRPDLIVYLHRPVPELLRNIAYRGRSFEQTIEAEYLEGIERSYRNYFYTLKRTPVLIVDLGEADFLGDRAVYDQLNEWMRRSYPAGVHHVRVEGAELV